METVIISPKAIVALLDADHPQHNKALAALQDMRDRGAAPLLTNYIVAETYSMLCSIVGQDAGRTWLRHNVWPIEKINENDESRAKEIILGVGNTKVDYEDVSYVEATTLALAERLGIRAMW